MIRIPQSSIGRLAVLLFLCAGAVRAAHAECFREVGVKYGIDPVLLRAISQVESGGVSESIHSNRGGSEDVGLMQINSIHLPRLKQQGITRARLLSDACVSIDVGANILSDFIRRFGYTWRAVGAYNAGAADARESLRARYAIKVFRVYRRLLAERQQHTRALPLVRH